MNSSLTAGAVPESRICFTSGSCQLITGSADLTVLTGTPGVSLVTMGGGRCSGVYPLDEISEAACDGVVCAVLLIGVCSQARILTVRGGTQRNRSSTLRSKIIVTVMINH